MIDVIPLDETKRENDFIECTKMWECIKEALL